MAFSAWEGKKFFEDWVENVAKPLTFKNFLDVGCGAGIYGRIIREKMGEVDLTGCDIFPEYITRHRLTEIYNKMVIGDIRDPSLIKDNYDLITAGDVLEHLTKDEAIEVVNRLRQQCKFMWCALPLNVEGRDWSTGYKQPDCDFEENPNNKHWYDWKYNEIKEIFSPIFIVPFIQTGVFLIEGAK